MGELEKLRKEIDSIDSKIRSLLEQRLRLAVKILKVKKKKKLKIFQPEREKRILGKIKADLRPIFKAIIRETRKFQQKRKK